MKRQIVLVPGAWQGAWVWEQVTPLLTAEGFQAVPITLPGLGVRSGEKTRAIDLESHIRDVVTTLVCRDLSAVTLVGHSYASIVITGVADRVPERIGHLVYLDAAPFDGGRSFLEAFPPEQRARHQQQAEPDKHGWWLPFPGWSELASTTSADGLSPEARQRMLLLSTPHPFETWTQPLTLTCRTGALSYAHTLVLCTSGGLTASGLRQLVASGDQNLAHLGGFEWSVEELHTGHWPMISEPEETASLLGRLAASTPPGGDRT